MPGNKLWKIDVARRQGDRRARELKDVETIWSLAAAGDTVYAGTGPSGKLYAIKGGTAQARCSTPRTSASPRSTVTSDGAVWMGTSERALVFRYDPKDGKTRAMADFAGNEVTAIAPYRDGVVVAANDLAEHAAADRQDRRRRSRPPRSRTRRRARPPRRPTSAPSPAPTRIRRR